MQPFVKMFAAPGIDSSTSEQGLFNSGAGLDPNAPTMKTAPFDWGNETASQGYQAEHLVGNYGATKAPDATSMKIRKRGLSPFGGFFPGKRQSIAYQHPGGIADMNPGANSMIAGGTNRGVVFCRVNSAGASPTRRMKLPTLPQKVTRGGVSKFPTGGGSHEPLVAPMQPQIQGWPTIFKFVGVNASPGR